MNNKSFSDTTEYNLSAIEVACSEIADLLLLPKCQKHQVLTEVQIILESVQKIRKNKP